MSKYYTYILLLVSLQFCNTSQATAKTEFNLTRLLQNKRNSSTASALQIQKKGKNKSEEDIRMGGRGQKAVAGFNPRPGGKFAVRGRDITTQATLFLGDF